jgi:ABC-type branched-subunit amino acid transport system substrate-binding protein
MSRDVYVPPRPRWARRRRTWVAAVGLMLIAGLSVIGVENVTACDSVVDQAGLRTGCVGVSDGQSLMASDLADVEKDIHDQNQAVVDSGVPYVSVAFLTPMSLVPGRDAATTDSVLHELEGAYVAQYLADNGPAAVRPRIRLLLANDGSLGEQWPTVVGELKQRTGGSDHLVAVAGLGQSLKSTADAIHQLDSVPLAMVGDTITADDLHQIRSLVRVSAPNTDEAYAAAQYLPSTSQVLVIQDTNPDDLYARTLGDKFTTRWKPRMIIGQVDFDSGTDDAADRLVEMSSDICASGASVVYFAGRGRDLGPLLTGLNTRICSTRPIEIVSGDDASSLDGSRDVRHALAGKISLVYTGLAHPDEWNRSTVKYGYPVFLGQFTSSFPSDAGAALDDGNAMMAYDSMETVVAAVRLTANARKPVTAGGIIQHWSALNGLGSCVAGASGPIAFAPDGNPTNKPIPVLAVDQTLKSSFVTLQWPTGTPSSQAACQA